MATTKRPSAANRPVTKETKKVQVVAGTPSGEIVLTALPHGIRKEGSKRFLRLSVHVAPQLKVSGSVFDPTLARFPEFLDWPAQVKGMQFTVEFAGGSAVQGVKATFDPAQRPNIDPESDLWTALFKKSAKVQSFEIPESAKRPILDYPVAHVEEFIKQKYLEVASKPETVLTMPTVAQLAGEDMFGMVAFEPQNVQVAARQLSGSVLPANRAPMLRQDLMNTLVASRAIPHRALPEPDRDFLQAELFQKPLVTAKIAKIEPPDLDFHTAVSSVSRYPDLMRRLGLVIDLEIDASAVKNIQSASTVRVSPVEGSYKGQCKISSPRTAYVLTADSFLAAPRPTESDIQNGMLKLSSDDFKVINVDVDSAVGRTTSFANNLVAMLSDKQRSMEPTGLPTLRTTGLSVIRNGRGAKMAAQVSAAFVMYAAGATKPLYADDVMRGIRVDVWDSKTSKWHSLCQRRGEYTFVETGKKVQAEDEGFVSSAVTKPPADKPDDPAMRMHQALFQWSGWSLCAPRPGNTIKTDDSVGLPEKKVDNTFRLKTEFHAKPGSLPKLRFGTVYRLRARVVDLAGNSLAYDEPNPTDFTLATPPITYARFEPVTSPAVVLRKDPKGQVAADKPAAGKSAVGGRPVKTAAVAAPVWASPGESVEHLVIRSANDTPAKDTAPSDSTTDRHVAPPKVAQLVAEMHGMFDSPTGFKPDSYTTITGRDGSLKEIEPADQLTIPYLPDPKAASASLSGLRGASDTQTVSFYPKTSWPEARAFRVQIKEGGAAPKWDEATRVLTVYMPKAEQDTFQISCSIAPEHLDSMGVWQWLERASKSPAALTTERERAPVIAPANAPATPTRAKPKIRVPKLDVSGATARPTMERHDTAVKAKPVAATAAAAAASQGTGLSALGALKAVRVTPEAIAKLRPIAIGGRHWMITPYRTITVVHAVQQPLGIPKLEVTARKSLFATSAMLYGKFNVHGKSTASSELVAEWSEPIDPLSKPKWETISGHARVLTEQVKTDDSVLDFARIAHDFHDTKYRKVNYSAISTTRFREYFPSFVTDDPKNITRTSPVVSLDILNSARPAAPKVLYVIPTFGWGPATTTKDGVSRKRSGGGLRVYLDRPWYSSGDGELLGVVINQTASVPSSLLKSYVTQWGFDPIWGAPALDTPVPTANQFKKIVAAGNNLSIAELAQSEEDNGPKVNVLGHKVEYDEERKLWFCDIAIDPGRAYYPFVRLALARFQPKSVAKAELSRIVITDFAQLSPDRTVGVTFKSPTELSVGLMGGPMYWSTRRPSGQTAGTSEVEVEIEQRRTGVPDDLAWIPVGNTKVALTVKHITDTISMWEGSVKLPQASNGNYRLVVREYERFQVDKAIESEVAMDLSAAAISVPTDRRLVYADALILQ